MQHVLDYLNGYLDCVERLLALRLPQLENLYATLSQFPAPDAAPDLDHLLTWVHTALQAKHERLSQQSSSDAKYYYARKPRHWAEALQRVQINPIESQEIQNAIAQFFSTGSARPANALAEILPDAMTAGFLELLQTRLLQQQYQQCQFYELSNTPFPLSSHYGDALDASREFVFFAPATNSQQAPAIYYLALGLREEWSM